MRPREKNLKWIKNLIGGKLQISVWLKQFKYMLRSKSNSDHPEETQSEQLLIRSTTQSPS